MKKPAHFERLNSNFEPDTKGRFFFDGQSFCDLSQLNVLRCGVDTVRQLYNGYIKSGFLEVFEKSGTVFFGEHEWHSGRIGRDSGYQFKLQNADLGLVILVKNFNVKPELFGPHLKIEVSPHLIDELSPAKLQALLDQYASLILDAAAPNQSAVHVAIDVQGWQPPADLVARMHCRSRAVRQFDGADTIDFAQLSVTYGRGETYMFGSPSSVQLCIYNKAAQAKATDKLDFWEYVWRKTDNPFEQSSDNYNPDLPVWRIEFRFHHSVVKQFAEGSKLAGTDMPIYFSNYHALSYHLDGLLSYGFDAFKFLHEPSHFHPLWTVLAQDLRVEVSVTSLFDKTDYKRYYKTSKGFSGKNVELMMGNAISLAARNSLTPKQLIKALKSLPFWQSIQDHYADKGMKLPELVDHIAKLLNERHVRWGRAI